MIQDKFHQGTLKAADEVFILDVTGMASASIQVVGTMSATLVFEATTDSSTWFSVNAYPPTTTVAVTGATAAGIWVVNVASFKLLRVRCSAYTSGSPLISLSASLSGFRSSLTPVANADGSPIGTGNVASGATDSSNPVKVGGKYNATPPTFDNGQRGDLQMDANGNTKVTLATNIAGEDLTNDVMKTEQAYSSSGILTADTAVKTGAGRLHTVTFSQNDAAPTAGTIDILDATAASGTPKLWSWTLTTAVFNPFTITLDIPFSIGLYVDFTTTNDVNVVCSYR